MKLRFALRATAVGLALSIATIGGQLFMALSAEDKAREAAIQEWELSNPVATNAVQSYREACEGKTALSLAPSEKPPLTFAECLARVGSDSLADAIREASNTVAVPAPLRWL